MLVDVDLDRWDEEVRRKGLEVTDGTFYPEH